MSQVTLPMELERSTLRLAEGAVVFTVPWAMWFDPDGRGWLSLNFACTYRPQGALSMRVVRSEGGAHVDLYGVEHTWERSARKPSDSDVPVFWLTGYTS